MELVVDNSLSTLLFQNNIYQARTGMKRKFETPKSRWTNGTIINFEKDTLIEEFTTFAAGNNLFSCGMFSAIASDLGSNIKVGRYSEIATGCRRMGYRHPIEAVSTNSAIFNFYRENVYSYFQKYEEKNGILKKEPVPTPQPQRNQITIGNDVWIGNDVVLKGNISIGDGAVICSNSVVTKDIPPYTICGGIPAKVIKSRFPDKICEELIASKWYEYELGDMYKYNFNFSSPEVFLENFNNNKHLLGKSSPSIFSPYEYLAKKTNQSDVKNLIITHHLTILVVNISTNTLNHKFYYELSNDDSPIYIEKQKQQYILKLNNGQYIKEFVNDKVVTSDTECYFNSISAKNNILTFYNNAKQYLSARKNGKFSYVNNPYDWEQFSYFDTNTIC